MTPLIAEHIVQAQRWLARRDGRTAFDPEVSRAVAVVRGLLADLLHLQQIAWQPIETAPKDGQWVLGWNCDAGFFVWRDGPGLITGEDPEPTHWMPLPDPPSSTVETLGHTACSDKNIGVSERIVDR